MKFFATISRYSIEKKIISCIVIIALIALFVMFIGFLDWGRFDISIYEVSSEKIDESVRVVCVSDLHLREFGKNNEKLIEKIKSLKPDIIAVPGDLTISGRKDHTVAVEFLKNLKEVAPVYYSYGNHEYGEILFDKSSTLRNDIKNTGVQLVNNSSVTATVNGNKIEIGGFCASEKSFDNAAKFLKEYEKKDGYKLLLCHHVECFETAMEEYPVDLALTAHAHGGQFRLPVVGPLFAPDQGLFPKLTEGMHELCGSTVIISRGLGNSHFVPRFNNNPEIVVVDIKGI